MYCLVKWSLPGQLTESASRMRWNIIRHQWLLCQPQLPGDLSQQHWLRVGHYCAPGTNCHSELWFHQHRWPRGLQQQLPDPLQWARCQPCPCRALLRNGAYCPPSVTTGVVKGSFFCFMYRTISLILTWIPHRWVEVNAKGVCGVLEAFQLRPYSDI